jgi:glycosyltransferase involved in cell wall biosynthesis
VTADVSIVIPTRNRVRMVVRAIRCALGQTGVATEVIVIDDGSSDGTQAAVRDRFGDRVTLVRRDGGQGVGSARNEGIRRASGEYVAFLDDDDVWAPQKLISQIEVGEHTGRGWVYAGMVTVDARLRILYGVRPDPAEVIARDILVRNRLPSGPSNVVVRRELLESSGGFDPDLRYHEDWDLWIRLSRASPPACVDRPLLAHVEHGGNTPVDAILGDMRTIEERYAALRGGRQVDRGAVHRWIASAHLRERRRWRAARAYMDALLASPVESARWAALALRSDDIGPGTAYRRPPDEDGKAQAESWLAPLRED